MKTFVREADSEQARTLLATTATVVSASVTYVEARSALAAARRARRLSGRGEQEARADLETFWKGCAVVELAASIVASAGTIAERHRLRALDAIHVASAFALDDPDLVVASWDNDLRRAAVEAGLAVAP